MVKNRKQVLYETLLQLSQIHAQQQLRKIALLERNKTRLTQQVQSLNLARDHYNQSRYTTHTTSSSELKNQENFLSNIRLATDSLFAEQQKVQLAIEDCWAHWRTLTHSQKAYEKLADTALKERLAHLQKQERKIEDEIASIISNQNNPAK